MMGLLPVTRGVFQNFKEILEKGDPAESRNRFWLYPVQPQAGDIQMSSDRSTVLFLGNVQVLSEEMARCQQGLIGKGKPMLEAEEAAVNFTQAYPAIEQQYDIYKKLKGLFDIVLLAKVWQETNVQSDVIDRLVALPYRTTAIPETYAAVEVEIAPASQALRVLEGGVQAKMSVGPRSFLVLDDPEITQIRDKAQAFPAGSVAAPIAGVSLQIPQADAQQRDTANLALTAALAKVSSGDAVGAQRDLTELVDTDPYDPEPLAFRAQVELLRHNYAKARVDARKARALDPENPSTVYLSSLILFQLDSIDGKSDQAMAEVDYALKRDPTSAQARILRGNALAALGRVSEARSEYKQAIRRDPTSAYCYVQLGLLEMSQGWVVKAKSLIEKGRLLSKAAHEPPQITAAMAMAELANASVELADSTELLALANRYAHQALDDPVCDPQSQMLALTALGSVAMIRSDWNQADFYLQKLQKIAPKDPEMLLIAAETAHDARHDDMAQKYLSQAEQIAPDSRK